MKNSLPTFLFSVLLSMSIVANVAYANDKDIPSRSDIAELLEISGTYKIASQIINQVMIAMKDSYNQNRATEKKIPDEIWSKVIDEFKTELTQDSYIDMIVPVYQKYYSKEDVKEIVAFYKSRVGQKMISVMPEIMKDSRQAGREWGKKAAEKILPRLEQRLKDLGYPAQNVG